jgi:excisionase family DNA binding protein
MEAANIIGISRRMAYELARKGELPGVRKLGSRYVVSKKLLEDWLQGKTVHLPIT